jgi:hypothetical protein
LKNITNCNLNPMDGMAKGDWQESPDVTGKEVDGAWRTNPRRVSNKLVGCEH